MKEFSIVVIVIFLLFGMFFLGYKKGHQNKITFDVAEFIINDDGSFTLMPIEWGKAYKLGKLYPIEKEGIYFTLSMGNLQKRQFKQRSELSSIAETMYIFNIKDGALLEHLQTFNVKDDGIITEGKIDKLMPGEEVHVFLNKNAEGIVIENCTFWNLGRSNIGKCPECGGILDEYHQVKTDGILIRAVCRDCGYAPRMSITTKGKFVFELHPGHDIENKP